MRTVPCYCENVIETDLPELIDLEVHSEYYAEIQDGSFQNLTCDKCGLLLKPELRVRLKDASRHFDLLFIPEADRGDFLKGAVDCEAPRLAIGYPELVEKISLLMAALDDGAVEILKYFLKKKTGNDDVLIYFRKVEDDHLIFHIHGLKEDQVASTRLPAAVYRDTEASLPEKRGDELFSAILEPPYVSANKISILEEEQ